MDISASKRIVPPDFIKSQLACQQIARARIRDIGAESVESASRWAYDLAGSTGIMGLLAGRDAGMAKHMVLVGAGHAHLEALVNLGDYVERGHRATVVSASSYHYYSGMGPGMLSGLYRPQEARFNVRKTAEDRGADFLEDTVTRIDAEERVLFLESGGRVGYDVVSFNIGSMVPLEGLAAPGEPDVFPVKPIVNLLEARRRVLEQLAAGAPARLVVVGGGPAGVEVAANAWRLVASAGESPDVTLAAGSRLLPAFPARARSLAMASLAGRGVEVLEGTSVRGLAGGAASFDDGRTAAYTTALVAVGVKPSPLFSHSGLPTGADGGLLVNSRLQSVERPEVFGGGDCISLDGRPCAKVGVYAVRQNPVLRHNLMAALEGRPLKTFDPGGAYLLALNMGDGRAIGAKWGLTCSGRWMFRLKDHIDRRFMRRFQVSGERGES